MKTEPLFLSRNINSSHQTASEIRSTVKQNRAKQPVTSNTRLENVHRPDDPDTDPDVKEKILAHTFSVDLFHLAKSFYPRLLEYETNIDMPADIKLETEEVGLRALAGTCNKSENENVVIGWFGNSLYTNV